MKLFTISSIFDDVVGQKRPAPKGYGQICSFRRQNSSPCIRKLSEFFLELSKFGSYHVHSKGEIRTCG
mgnify:CR=1 FL=1